MPQREVMTRLPCALCDGTGADNPDAGHSMDWRDYLPCIACRGTGYSIKKVPAEKGGDDAAT